MLVNALQHGITIGPGGTSTVIRINITPLISRRGTAVITEEVFPLLV
jgi:hypothetical protein